MKKSYPIFKQGEHSWIAISRDPERPHYMIDTNEYLISEGEDCLLTDPGGSEVFSAVFSALSEVADPSRINHLFASHQDPDIISSLPLWLEFNPNIRCYLSQLWTTFVPHFGGSDTTFCPLPDQGAEINIGKLSLQAVPAHYLHSSGNFHLYDAKARMLFSGDIGAALGFPEDNGQLFVKDFDRHITFAAGFHRRWMGSEPAKRDWCERVSNMKIDMLCPQHGAIYCGPDVERFINWFAELKIGSGV